MLADRLHRPADAAIEFRRILDEKPRAGRVRLELARMHALLGHPAAAARELRAAQASGLPPDVQRVVRFYAGAFEATKPFGYSLAISVAPDTNINRATRTDTLGTVIGNFTLDEDAKAQSGIGLALRGQAFARQGIDRRSRLLVQVSGQADLYREGQFNDVIAAVQAGPEMVSGHDRLNVNAQASWRWYGGLPFSRALGVNASLLHPLGNKAQVRIGGGVADEDNRRNDFQDATVYSLSLDYDRALTARLGGGVQLFASRNAARDPGYSTASGGVSAYLFRELGPTTLVANLGYNHLEADRRLSLYPQRRIDDRFSAGLGLTLRLLQLGGFSPVARIRYERNRSTLQLYDYSRVSGEFGVTAAF